LRVIIADDLQVVRIGVRALLQASDKNYQVIGEAGNWIELMYLFETHACDTVIVELTMPSLSQPGDGVAFLRHLHERYPGLSIVVLTMLRNPALFRALYEIGVSAVIEKSSRKEDLLLALETVEANRVYISKHVMEMLVRDRASAQPGGRKEPNSSLSVREVAVMRMLVDGMRVSDIARRSGLSVKTISRQKRDAMRKLGITHMGNFFEYAHQKEL
jgi:two-component system capsular synthesis response regulator RcsB